MRLAALYDIHGNLPALEAVLEEVATAGVDRIVVGGDVVPGPMPSEALDRLLDLDLPVDFVRGNGESAVLARRDGDSLEDLLERVGEAVAWSAAELRPEQLDELSTWPATVRVAVDGLGEVLFCHATPLSDTEIFTRDTPRDRLQKIFAETAAALVVCGHTHMQFDRSLDSARIVNAGSVGMPFGRPGAYWLLVGPEAELRCTAYDLAAAAERVRSTAYPQAEEFAASSILEPPSEAEMLALFS